MEELVFVPDVDTEPDHEESAEFPAGQTPVIGKELVTLHEEATQDVEFWEVQVRVTADPLDTETGPFEDCPFIEKLCETFGIHFPLTHLLATSDNNEQSLFFEHVEEITVKITPFE